MRASLQNQVDIQWDVIVIGGGATGAGVAFDASSRGFKHCCLNRLILERYFEPQHKTAAWRGKVSGTGDIVLVIEALKERG
jgi:glycerol-3-phosphate dehydrogenase